MSDKYTIKPTEYNADYILFKDGVKIAIFTEAKLSNEVAKTNAQKVCDLLNETSRAQGKF